GGRWADGGLAGGRAACRRRGSSGSNVHGSVSTGPCGLGRGWRGCRGGDGVLRRTSRRLRAGRPTAGGAVLGERVQLGAAVRCSRSPWLASVRRLGRLSTFVWL